MPTGRHGSRQARGFTYLLLLFALVAGSSALAALATAWTTAAQRQRELESQFRGQQIADAIGRYVQASPADSSDGTAGPLAAAQGPAELAELLQDPRSAPTLRHLRRLYEDPLTGQADWVLLRNAQGRIEALHSRSRQPALLSRGLDGAALVSDRVYRPRQGPVAAVPLPPAEGDLQENGRQNAPPNALPNAPPKATPNGWPDAPPMARSDYGRRAGHGKPSPQVASLGPAVAPRP